MSAEAINEKAEARALSPSFAWPTLLYIALIWSIHATMIYLALSGVGQLWMWTIPLAYIAFTHYTYVHEAIHGNILPKGRVNRIVQDGLGSIGSMALFGNWAMLSRTHKGHHSHLNTDKDPDIFVKKALWRLLLRNVMSGIAQLIPLPILKLIIKDRSPSFGYLNSDITMTRLEKIGHYGSNLVMVAFVWTCVFLGYGWEVFLLYYIPAQGGYNFLAVVFQWLPHHPFESGDRYQSSRNLGYSWLNPVLQYQNWHLMHHLWPSVPFYNYQRLYKRIKPILEEKGARHNDGIIPKNGPIGGPKDTPLVPAE